MNTTWRNGIWYLLSAVLLVLALSPGVYAQNVPETDILQKAKMYEGLELYEKAVEQYKLFLEQYPRSSRSGEARSAMCMDYLRMGKRQEAQAVWQEQVDAWPRAVYLWPIIQLSYRLQIKAGEDKFLETYGIISAYEDLPANWPSLGKLIWFEHLANTNTTTFINESLKAIIGELDPFADRTQLLLPVMLCQRTYEPLMRTGRLEEARKIHLRLQEIMALKGNPYNWMSDDTLSYYTTLGRCDIKEFSAQMSKHARMLKYDRNPQEAEATLSMFATYYSLAIPGGQIDEPLRVHEMAVKELTRIGDKRLIDSEQASYHGALKSVPFDVVWQRFREAIVAGDLPKAQALAATMKTLAPKDQRTTQAEALLQEKAPK
ncbi:MAG: tetratricopeptide repeat protein [Armatimonadota bacterium]